MDNIKNSKNMNELSPPVTNHLFPSYKDAITKDPLLIFFRKSSEKKDIIPIASIRCPNVTLRKKRGNKGRTVEENKLYSSNAPEKIVNSSSSVTYFGLTLDFWSQYLNFDNRVLKE